MTSGEGQLLEASRLLPTTMAAVCGLLRYLGDFLREHPRLLRKKGHVGMTFIFCAVWGFGGHLPRAFYPDKDQTSSETSASPVRCTAADFSDWWRKEFKQDNEAMQVFPRQGLVSR